MACKALGNNPFSDEVVETFFQESRFQRKVRLMEELQKPRNLNTYITVPGISSFVGISSKRYAAFCRLRLIQLRELMKQTENEKLFSYMNMLLTFYTATFLEGEKFRNMINRQEIKLIKLFSTPPQNISKNELRRFIFASCLCSDVQFLYEQDVLQKYLMICTKI